MSISFWCWSLKRCCRGVAMNLKQQIGSRVKSARVKRGFTQDQLAEELGKSVETISNLERGAYMTSLETLLRVGQCLRVSPSYFFEDADAPRTISRARLESELELRRLAEDLTDNGLRMAIRLVRAITG